MWSKKHARFVGRVIFANFLELPLEKYKRFIRTVEASPLFEKAVRQRRLSRSRVSRRNKRYSPRVVAEIARGREGFSIRYAYEGFNNVYLFDKRLLSTRHSLLSHLHKLRRISSRNELTHRILKGIINHQGRYLETGDASDLAPLSQLELARRINSCNSWVSRLVNGLSVIIPSGEKRTLKSFFSTRKDINKRLIKQLLDRENEAIESGRLKKPLTDNQIRAKLAKEYGVKLSRWSVGHCRKDMGILPATRRLSGYKYPPLSANFSLPYPLTFESVQTNAPASPGIYEFRLRVREIKYPAGRTQVIYIGSTGNIKKRLGEHISRKSKNSDIKHFLKKFNCSFRYILFKKDWQEEERRLYRLFMDTYGSAPRCNRVRP